MKRKSIIFAVVVAAVCASCATTRQQQPPTPEPIPERKAYRLPAEHMNVHRTMLNNQNTAKWKN